MELLIMFCQHFVCAYNPSFLEKHVLFLVKIRAKDTFHKFLYFKFGKVVKTTHVDRIYEILISNTQHPYYSHLK